MGVLHSIITSYFARKFASHFRSEAVGRQDPAAKTQDATSINLEYEIAYENATCLICNLRARIQPHERW